MTITDLLDAARRLLIQQQEEAAAERERERRRQFAREQGARDLLLTLMPADLVACAELSGISVEWDTPAQMYKASIRIDGAAFSLAPVWVNVSYRESRGWEIRSSRTGIRGTYTVGTAYRVCDDDDVVYAQKTDTLYTDDLIEALAAAMNSYVGYAEAVAQCEVAQ